MVRIGQGLVYFFAAILAVWVIAAIVEKLIG